MQIRLLGNILVLCLTLFCFSCAYEDVSPNSRSSQRQPSQLQTSPCANGTGKRFAAAQ